MGYAVDDATEMPSGYVPGEVEHHDQWRWPRPYQRYADLNRRGSGLAMIATVHRDLYIRAVGETADGAAVLVVSHGGGIEPALVACLPDADHGSWGEPFSHCDGARLSFEHGRFTDIEFHRAPPLSG